VTRNIRILIGVVVLAAAAGAYWMLLLSPKREQSTKLSTQVDLVQAEVTQAKATLADYSKAKSAYRKNYRSVVGLGKAVPADDDTRSLLVQLDTAAKRSGVNFASLDVMQGAASSPGATVATTQPGSTTPGAVSAGAFSTMPFNFSFVGDFATLSSFLSRVERFVTVKGDNVRVNGRLLRIDSITLQPGDGGWPAIQAQVGAVSFLVPDGTSQAPAAGGTAATGTSTSTSSSPNTTPSTSATNASDLR
jgi:Tfp pilus assembly protein PilO